METQKANKKEKNEKKVKDSNHLMHAKDVAKLQGLGAHFQNYFNIKLDVKHL
jgi:hypothetical protein